MPGENVRVASSESGTFDCYVARPRRSGGCVGLVLASAIHGVDEDIRAMADEFAAKGHIVAAPDLFWRSVPGPLSRDDARAAQRAQPRRDVIRQGETDLADTLAFLHTLPEFGGRAAVMGFCYGGPYALIGPKRLGYAAGVSCHGTDMLDYIHELEGLSRPVAVLRGDRDNRAPPPVLDAYRKIAQAMPNITLDIFPSVGHGYMMPANKAEYSLPARDTSIKRTDAILDALKAT